MTTLLKWDEDTELLFADNTSTEDFTAQADNPVAVEFRLFNDEVCFPSSDKYQQIVQRHNHGIHSHSGFLSSNVSLSALVLLFGLLTHSVFEGIALGSSLISTEFYSILIAVMIHEVLCSFALGVSLAQHNTTCKKAFMSSVVLASSIPMGMSSSIVISSMETFTALLIRFVLEGFAAGTFIYVACIEMLSSELSAHEHSIKQGLSKALAVITGVFAFFFVNVIFGQRSHSSHSLSQLAVIKAISVTPSMETAH
ncbi:unnamed protein product [Acanthocheilonema viteae]|uniref:Zinc/iron permease n=1 Tax=Acanthocheilonema viteae TaxID=6277 RepID=A0A498SXY9_ACAVI|nr:unnamed protein product [Acanthocheilonema viteae]